MIGIRADANEVVATGHIMRCITIAKQLKKRGEEVIFFLADDYGVSMLEENDMLYVVMHTDWENPKEELPTLCKEIAERKISAMLFDSYRMDREYFEMLRGELTEPIRLAYIDDLFEHVYPVDVVINYNAYHVQFPYEEAYEKSIGAGGENVYGETEATLLCLGPSYVPLREEFGKSDLQDGNEKNVLLSCGGGDTLQSLYGILNHAVEDSRFTDVIFHVIVGRFHQQKERLEELASRYENIKLHHNVSNMAALMENSQIAVSAAGTMLYELCAMERPTVFFITADNQRYDSDFFAENQRMIFAGDFRANKEACIAGILDGMHHLLNNKETRDKMKEKLRDVTDGNGADRIAEVLIG